MIQELQNGNRQTLEIEEMVDDFFLRNNHADISDAVIGRETMKIHNGNKYVSFQDKKRYVHKTMKSMQSQ